MKKYSVGLWPFAGYLLETFTVEAECAEQALDLAVVQAEKGSPKCLLEVEEVSEEDEDAGLYIYVDATMEGATRPYYIDAQNLIIQAIK